MFAIIKNYKSVFTGLVKSEFGRHLEWNSAHEDPITPDQNNSD